MISILIAIIAAIVCAVLLLKFSDLFSGLEFLANLAGIALIIAAGSAAAIYGVAGWEWLASDYKAKIINREYGTHYTREEVFYGSDVIDTIRELDRKRVELNGNLLCEDKAK